MGAQLINNLRVYREKFNMENYIGSTDIFALVQSGSFQFESKDGYYTVSANEGALFRKDVLYQRSIITPVTMYLFRYQSETPIFQSDKILFHDTARIESTFALLEKIDKGVFKNEFELRSNILADLITQYTVENNSLASTAGKISDPIGIAISQISENLHKKIELAAIGKLTGLSYVQFVRRFKAETGMTPSEYISVLRLQKAKNLLSETGLPIRQIAYACGFENEYYFSTIRRQCAANRGQCWKTANVISTAPEQKKIRKKHLFFFSRPMPTV